ncbi:MAG TPA: thioredoxin family protein [Bacilli bacterium]|nr:thioredoxin family protein [Bacilli bacterium]
MRIIKITSLWCPSCLIVNDILEEVAKEIEVINLDSDFDKEEVLKYNPGKILPILIFVNKNNKEIARLVGEQSKDKIKELIEKYNNE